MGRYKEELKRIHSKKVKKAKNKVRAFAKGEIPYSQLTSRAKKLFKKRKRKDVKAG